MPSPANVDTQRRSSFLDDILGAVPREVFLQDYLGRKPLHVPGKESRFSHLLPWAELNRLLETHTFSPLTLRLKRAGQDVPPDSYLTEYKSFVGTTLGTRVSTRVITDELRAGATLIVNSIHRWIPAIGALAEDLIEALDAHITINLYASFHESHGFGWHYDTHDVLVLQLHGRKHWQVLESRAMMPLPTETFDGVERPPEGATPIWDGLLAQGEVLYMPRGYWHFARPIGEPTMHLSIGMTKPTGVDVLKFLSRRLRRSEFLRRDVPDLDTPEAQERYWNTLREVVTNAVSQAELPGAFARDHAIAHGATSRAKCALPWAAMKPILPPSTAAVIHLTAAHGLRTYESPSSPGTFQVFHESKPALQVNTDRIPLFDYLMQHAPVTVEELLRHFQSTFSDTTLHEFLRELTLNGLIVVKEAEEKPVALGVA